MKMKMKALAAAVAFMAAGQASAALDLPSTNNGSLFLTVWDAVANVSYTRDLGLNLNDFLPSTVTTAAGDGGVTGTKTPNSGLTQNFAGDALFASTFASSLSGNIKWNILAGDSVNGGSFGVNRLLMTATTSTAPTVPNNNGIATYTNAMENHEAALNSLYGCNTAASCVPAGQGSGGAVGTGGEAGFGGVMANTVGTGFGSLMNFYYYTRSSATANGSLASTKLKFFNTTGDATWTLASDGTATYSLAGPPAAVPLPAAVWLMGSGLFGLLGVARRRNKLAAAA